MLLVEDSDDDVFLFQRAVKLAAIVNQVVRVETGDAAIAYLTGEGKYSDRSIFPFPFAVLLDLRLPGTDGWDVLKWIRSQPEFKDMLVIVLSGSERNTTIQQSHQRGATTFLRKPCKPDDLKALVRTFPGQWETLTAG